MTPLRVLCLHGYHGSANTLRSQMAPLTAGLEDLAQFICVDAPSIALGDFGWWHAKAAHDAPDKNNPGLDRRLRHYDGWPRSLAAIVSTFAQHGPFDGIFGFSQGAALTGLLAGLSAPDGRPPDQDKPLAFDFAVLIGGFPANDPELARLYDRRPSHALPSMHVIGRSDTIVPASLSRELASRFRQPLVLEHDGGHVIAGTPHVRSQFRAFLETMAKRKQERQTPPSRPPTSQVPLATRTIVSHLEAGPPNGDAPEA